jgi:acyl-CoA thioesterase FadM
MQPIRAALDPSYTLVIVTVTLNYEGVSYLGDALLSEVKFGKRSNRSFELLFRLQKGAQSIASGSCVICIIREGRAQSLEVVQEVLARQQQMHIVERISRL